MLDMVDGHMNNYHRTSGPSPTMQKSSTLDAKYGGLPGPGKFLKEL